MLHSNFSIWYSTYFQHETEVEEAFAD